MRADNTRHIMAAARQRRELTRAKAIQALRTLDAEGRPVTFEAVAAAAAVSRSFTASPTSGPRSNGSAPSPAGHPRHQSRPASDPLTRRCYGGPRPRTSGSGNWPRRTGASATNSPVP
jgi:hypothetical protein